MQYVTTITTTTTTTTVWTLFVHSGMGLKIIKGLTAAPKNVNKRYFHLKIKQIQ
jgi:hypothetical protein